MDLAFSRHPIMGQKLGSLRGSMKKKLFFSKQAGYIQTLVIKTISYLRKARVGFLEKCFKFSSLPEITGHTEFP
jgi:hypothetical protein